MYWKITVLTWIIASSVASVSRKMSILVTDVCGFAGVLIRFRGQKVNMTAGDDAETLWTPYYLTNHWREFYSILVTDLRGFIDVPISYWGQRSKVTRGNDMKIGWIQYLRKYLRANLGDVCIRAYDTLIKSKSQPSTYQRLIKNFMMMMMSRSQQAMTRKPCEHHISKTTKGIFTQFWSQKYVSS